MQAVLPAPGGTGTSECVQPLAHGQATVIQTQYDHSLESSAPLTLPVTGSGTTGDPILANETGGETRGFWKGFLTLEDGRLWALDGGVWK